MAQHVLLLDLQDRPELIEEYKLCHQPGGVPVEVLRAIHNAGVLRMDIYLRGNRLVMLLETSADFSFERWAAADAGNPAVCAWQERMWRYQLPLPGSDPGEKWLPAARVFSLEEHSTG